MLDRSEKHAEADAVDSRLRALLADSLGLPAEQVAAFDLGTGLFGQLPQFDSMAVATFLTGFEERFDVLIEDDDVGAEDFETYGSLLAFTRRMTGR